MAECTQYCEQLLYFDTKRHIKRSFTTQNEPTSSTSFTSSTAPEFHINFHLSCKANIYNWVPNDDSSRPQLLRRLRGPTIRKLIRLNLKQFQSKKTARKIIGKRIKKWPVWPDGRRFLIDFVLKKAWEKIESMPPSHNAVHLYMRVIPKHIHTFDEEDEIRYAIRRSMEGSMDGMVPAAESSIESLENATLLESGNCAICLEEFVNGGESVAMPCSHIFHRDCIKKWLSTSHYCPICRFQMPTS
ncbi:Ubiquitin--protein ligase [Handroanthus impetiginosus]|uniref:RING-type E3 ubiquitin transferase n=1 Tax=Handroanthus impetiginosus TaxID=429701 RepID=A0A2G9GFL4_9LAMI|nr:Ubiquitin--protein ligase [Handroanthus impetiginosus]